MYLCCFLFVFVCAFVIVFYLATWSLKSQLRSLESKGFTASPTTFVFFKSLVFVFVFVFVFGFFCICIFCTLFPLVKEFNCFTYHICLILSSLIIFIFFKYMFNMHQMLTLDKFLLTLPTISSKMKTNSFDE